MRRVAISLLAAAALMCAAFAPVAAAGIAPEPKAAPVSAQQQVDQHDDTRVEVQVAVLSIVAFTVVVVGGAGFLLRKRLGLVAPPPEQPAAGHGHH